MKKSALLLLAATAVVASALSGCGAEIARQMSQQHLDNAAGYAYSGHLAQAKLEVQHAIAEDPKNVGVYVDDSKLTETDEDTLELVNIEEVFASANDYQDVEAYDRQAIAKFPNDYHPLVSLMDMQNLLGETAAMQQTAHDLVTLLEAKVAKGNVDADALTELATGYWYSGDRQKATDTYQRIFKIDANEWPAYNYYAYEVAEADDKPDLAGALELAKQGLKQAEKQEAPDIQIAEIMDTIGWVEYRQGDYKQAEADVSAALETIPNEPVCLYHLGMIYLAEGDQASAKMEIGKSLMVMPDFADATSEWPLVKDAPAPPPIPMPDQANAAGTLSQTPPATTTSAH